MGRKKDRDFWESAAMNTGTYRQYYNKLCFSMTLI